MENSRMRVFYIALEIIWALLGAFCLGMAIYLQHRGYSQPMFYLLAAIACGMALFRFLMRRKRERENRRPRV